MPGDNPLRVSWKQVNGFRLSKHHLLERAAASKISSVLADIAGAQAQVLSAAQMSLWARAKIARAEKVQTAIWRERSLVRAWCMRGTMFLLPSKELAIFGKGTARRPEYNFRWAIAQVGSRQKLDELMNAVMQTLVGPLTRNELANSLNKSFGYKLKLEAGGGWGDSRAVPWVKVGKTWLSVGFLLRTIGAVAVICSGPNVGNESTYVRADRWIANWKDIPQEQAEEELLLKYLKAFGPATIADFALWIGLYVRDAKEIWSRLGGKIAKVDVEGWKAGVLESDLNELEKAEMKKPVIRLLPNFDTFLLGHKSHRNIVDDVNQKKIYRPQGWISPVLLINGRAAGVWSYTLRKSVLEIRVTPFSKLSQGVASEITKEVENLGSYFEAPKARTVIEAVEIAPGMHHPMKSK